MSWVAVVVVLLLLAVAAFPFGLLKGIVADRLTQRFGRPVSIASMERVDTIGLTPTIAVRGVTIRQAPWAGSGDFLRLREARVSFPLWPLLTGTFRPRDIAVTGLQLALVRDANGRTNWSRPGEPESGGASTDLDGLTVRDSVIRYRDDKRRRSAVMAFASDARGLRANGSGTIRGTPVRIALTGASVARAAAGPWPFSATIEGAALRMRAKGHMDRPLDTDAMTLDVDARAADLRLIDAVIEAGLFGTQPVAITAHVRHEAPKWIVTGLKGTIGRSDIAGHVTVDKQDGRTKLDGAVASNRFDFDDLSSDEGQAKAAALERAIGPRVVPNTRIDLSKIDRTDGRIAVRVARVFSHGGATSVTGLQGVLNLDRQRLRVEPLTIRLAGGVARGSVTVEQRGGARWPTLGVDLRLTGTRVEALAGSGGAFTGRIAAHARLTGRGETIRDAIGRSDGRIGFTVRDGALPARYAAALGFDAGRALFAGGETATLRCVVLALPVKGGRGVAAPLVVDTSASQLHGSGTVSLPAERIALRLTGAPKGNSVLRLPGAAWMTGTLSDPVLTVPAQVKSAGNIFKAIGRAITGRQGPTATDADCAGLAARALR
nr:AsmA-like C-terminal region-containing protein [Sphingomonas liriopis]